jgi:transcriptional regulator with XRE-family HTH domain
MSIILRFMDTLTALRSLAEAAHLLKALRLERNRTQEEVCAAVGLSRRALQALESGSAPDARLQTLLKLLRHYQCQLMIAPESPVPTLAELDFERQRSSLKPEPSPAPEPTRFRATGRRRRLKD